MKYIFVSGGVISGIGKGIASATIGFLLKARGLKISMLKCDPYINVDAGTLTPTEHGETFVLEDGLETDMDLGHYERYSGQTFSRENYMTTGSLYLSVIQKERQLEYGGRNVQVIPDVPNEIIAQIERAGKKDRADVVIIEIGGTVGEYENILFIEANRLMKIKYPGQVFHIHLAFLPIPTTLGEMKTKPVQMSVRHLNSMGLSPDMIIARSARPLDDKRKEKIMVFCSVPKNRIISAPDVTNIYEIPLNFERDHLSDELLDLIGIRGRRKNGIYHKWDNRISKWNSAKREINIGIVAKYFKSGDFELTDSYVSVIEALRHASAYWGIKTKLKWFVCEDIESGKCDLSEFDGLDGVIVPQGWGSRGTEGKIKAIEHIREHQIPYLGLCFGMQMAVIEFARNILGLKGANSEEVNPRTKDPVIHLMETQKQLIESKKYGGTIRLGAYPCKVKKGTILEKLYKDYKNDVFPKASLVQERHRHRYEFNNKYRKRIEKAGLIVSGESPDGRLVEAIELPHEVHPFFVATQFHPELKSRFLMPHPIFLGFMKAAMEKGK